MGEWVFNCQVLLNPISAENQKFKRDHLTYWTSLKQLEDMGLSSWPKYALCDMASWDELGRSMGLDKTALIVLSVAPDSRWYVLDCQIGRFEPSLLENMLFQSHSAWGWAACGIEEEKLSRILMYYLKPAMQKRGQNLPLVPLPTKGRNKHTRIQGLEPKWSRNEIVLNPDQKVLIRQFLRYPSDKHEVDGLDALAYALDLVPNRSRKVRRPQERSTAHSSRGGW